MQFLLNIHCNNATFGYPGTGEFCDEVARILHKAAEMVADGQTERAIMDSNGNRVGEWRFVSEEEAPA